ncbi:DUF2218 domain-containing protein [Terrihabitans sp. B22-R8]|uniref:DUF2218 domain-containing protein n=1 Tax=Terrihabitans sp. B22-R8 TaxID=3425128 RepID=UPI00403CDC43
MSPPELFVAEARPACTLPDGIIADICEHLEEHDARTRVGAGEAEANFPQGSIRLRREQDGFAIDVEATTLGDMLELREIAASHFLEFSRMPAEDLVWHGHGGEAKHPPYFRLMTVRRAEMIAPRMRRITLAGDDLARYDSVSNLHVKLLLPPDPAAPEWPLMRPSGLVDWPAGPNKPAVRKYTIRRIDPRAGEIDIDFVLHEDAGPGSRFGACAAPGDTVGMIGPGGRAAHKADYTVLMGDETALPAIARILSLLPPQSRGLACIEIDTASDRVPMEAPPNVELHWIYRQSGHSLISVARHIALPQGDHMSVWVGCEFQAFKALRRFFRKDLLIPADRQLIVSYWRRGAEAD